MRFRLAERSAKLIVPAFEAATSAHSRGRGNPAFAKSHRPSTWNVNEKDQPWVNEKFTAQPIGVAFTPLRLTGARDRVPRKTYVRAKGYDNPNFESYYAKVKSDRSWRTYEVPCGHEMMIDMPERTAEILLEVA